MAEPQSERAAKKMEGSAVPASIRSSGEPIRVLHLLYTMAYGGVETTVIQWLRALDRSRFQVCIVCFANPGETEAPFVRAAEAASLVITAKIPWRRSKPLLSATLALRNLIREHRIDVLHCHNTYSDILGALVRLLVPVRLITTQYVWGDFGWKRNLLQWVNVLAIRRFDLVSAHCEGTRQQTIDRGFTSDAVRLLISGYEARPRRYDQEERKRRRRELGVEEGDVVLANLARFFPEKAQDGLLRSFRKVVDSRPEARLWLVGIGPLEGNLRRLCGELGLDHKVRFMGFVDDLQGLLELVDMQVHPSHMEGVALSVCAGMAAGRPIVASNVGGLPEVLRHGQTGILVPAGDESAFAAAVLDLMEHPDRAATIGAAARRFIETEYSLQRAAQDLGRAYLEVMGRCD